MSKVSIARRCFNCGALLQHEDKEKDGYIENECLLESDPGRILFCDECYKEAGLDISLDPLEIDDNQRTILKDAVASDALIVYLIDSFSFESSFVKEVNELIKRNPILVLANKSDLFKDYLADKDLKEYIAHRFRVSGLPLSEDQVLLVSLKTFTDFKNVNEEIEARRKRHDVFVISPKGSGKNMFFSSFLYSYKNVSDYPVRTEIYKGTNFQGLKIPLDNSSFIFDTPSLPISNSVLDKVDRLTRIALANEEKIVSSKHSLKKEEALALGNICFIEPISIKGKEEKLTLYVSEKVSSKVVSMNKGFEKAFDYISNKKHTFPRGASISNIKDFDALEIEVEEKGNRSIGIEGLGWISFAGDKQIYRIYVPKGVSIYTSRSKI